MYLVHLQLNQMAVTVYTSAPLSNGNNEDLEPAPANIEDYQHNLQ